MENQGGLGAMGASSASPSSVRAGTGNKRKRSGVDFESSPGTGAEEDQEGTENRRTPGVKRACNECRQQKVTHKSQSRNSRIYARTNIR